MEDVLAGRVVAGKLVRRACARQKHDIEHGPSRGLYFDRDAAQYAIDFYGFCKHSKGNKWAGTTVKPEPWQQFIDWCVYGWKWKASGLRRFRVVYESVARKNGKSTRAAIKGLFGLSADSEKGADIYSAATKREQARIIFGEAQRMRNSSPELRKFIGSVKDNLHIIETNSKFEPLGADRDTMDGLNVHYALIDELHAHKTRGIWDILDTATGSREQSLLYAVTTAGSDKSPKSICWEQHRYSMLLLDGFDKEDGIKDDTYFCYIATLDAAGEDPNNPLDEHGVPKADDPFDERCWMKANPNLGVSKFIDDMRRKALRAKQSTAALNTFLRLELNVWTDAVSVWIPTDRWDQCRADFKEEDLAGERCWAGVDLTNVRDLASVAYIFPREIEPIEVKNPIADPDTEEAEETVEIIAQKFRVINRYYLPEVTAENRSRQDALLYKSWVKDGWIKETEGDVVDYDEIHSDIIKDGKKFDIYQIGIDRWNATGTITALQKAGFTVIPFGQGFQSMNEPCKKYETLVCNRAIEHDGNPVTRWCFGNVSVKTDPAGAIKTDKEKSVDKIDGVQAQLIALGTFLQEPPEPESVYTKRGLRTT